MNYSYVCVLSTDHYLEGVLVLNENLKRLNSRYPLLCLINETIREESREILDKFEIPTKEMKTILIDNYPETRWKYTFDKINVFSLLEYDKIVYLDSDFLILENLDHLFDIDEFSMVYDYRPDKENYCCSALMVIKPNMNDYKGLIDLVRNSWDGEHIIGDQDVINEYFPIKNEISVDYNNMKEICKDFIEVEDSIKKCRVKKYKCQDYYYSFNPKIIHYVGDLKPFMIDREFDDSYCYLYFYYLNIIRKRKEAG